jgi:hypothetical protein
LYKKSGYIALASAKMLSTGGNLNVYRTPPPKLQQSGISVARLRRSRLWPRGLRQKAGGVEAEKRDAR